MALYLVEISSIGRTRFDGVKAMVVEADSATVAKALAAAQYEGDADWSTATATEIAAGVASDYEGFTYRVKVGAASAGDPDLIDVSYTGVASDTVDLIGEALENALRGETVEAAIADDGGVFTDETTEANEDTSDDMTILPAAIAENDAYYFGSSQEFTRLVIEMSQAGVGTYTLAWEYWDGDSWETLTGASGDLKATGRNVVTWTMPADWATTTINSQGPFYFVRCVADTGNMTTEPLGERAYVRGHTSALYTAGTNTLIVAAGSGVDDLGDLTMSVEAFLPNAKRSLAALVGTVTDGGASTDDLTVVFEDETAIPAIMSEL